MPVARTPPHATRAPRAAPGQARRAADRAQRPSHRRRCTNIAPNPRASTAPPTQLAPQNMVCLTRRPARAPTRVAPSPGPLLASPPGMNTVVAVVAPRRAGGPRGQDLRPGMPFLAFQHHRGPHTNCSGCCVCMVSNCPQPQDHADRLRTDPHSHTPADPKAGAQGRPGMPFLAFQHHRGPHPNCSRCCVCMVSNCPRPQDHADRLRTDPHSHTPELLLQPLRRHRMLKLVAVVDYGITFGVDIGIL